MVFIVEMWAGQPHELQVQELDTRGDLTTISVIRDGPPDPVRRTFSCHGNDWKMAQNLGRSFGWQPKGPLFHPWHATADAIVRVDEYDPDGWIRGLHEVEADDARAWGQALEACADAVEAGAATLPNQPSAVLLREGMTLKEFRQANRGLTVQFLRSFAKFLSKGAFKFGWDS